jgi:hypothetical protein
VGGLALGDRDTPHVEDALLVVTRVQGDGDPLAALADAPAAVLLRAPTVRASFDRLARSCAERGLGLALLEVGEPWWPVLRHVEAALGASAPANDLFDLADDIAAAVGGPVILEDASFQVLAYSAFVGEMDRGRTEAILGRRIPAEWREHLERTGSLQRLRAGADVVDLPDGPWQARRRLITAVRTGSRQLGVVWVAEGDRPLPPDAAQALRRAADSAAPQLLRYLEEVEAEADRRSRQVSALLDGRAPAVAAATGLGLAPAGRFAVLALRSLATEPSLEEAKSRLQDHVNLCCQSFRRPPASAPAGTDVLVVVQVRADEDDGSPERLLQEMVRLTGSGAVAPVQGAASPVGQSIGALPRLRDQALAALAVLERDGRARSVTFEEVEPPVLVREVVGRLDASTRLRALERLREHDSRTGGQLLETLRTYLDCTGSATQTAATLEVHVTTLRHRLRRIEQVSGLSLAEPAVRIACGLVLRLHKA